MKDSAEQIVQANLDAYNARDIEAFMRSFSADIALHGFHDSVPHTLGLDAIRVRYRELFDASPQLHSTIIKRIVLKHTVIDHERIVGRNGSPQPYELVLIYEVRDALIFRLTAIRE